MKKFIKDIPANSEEWLKKEYIFNKKSIREISFMCGVNSGVIRDRLIKYGIPIRGRKEANILSAVKKPAKYIKTEKLEQRHRNMKTGIFKKCENCCTDFYVNKGRINKKRFCSNNCRHEWSKNNRIVQEEWRDEPEYKIWRKSVYEKNNWKCALCGSKKKINAHHILYGNNFSELRFNADNGITLCEFHHILLHKYPCSFIEESVKQIPNIGGTPETDNPEASIRNILYALTTTKEQPERLMV